MSSPTSTRSSSIGSADAHPRRSPSPPEPAGSDRGGGARSAQGGGGPGARSGRRRLSFRCPLRRRRPRAGPLADGARARGSRSGRVGRRSGHAPCARRSCCLLLRSRVSVVSILPRGQAESLRDRRRARGARDAHGRDQPASARRRDDAPARAQNGVLRGAHGGREGGRRANSRESFRCGRRRCSAAAWSPAWGR